MLDGAFNLYFFLLLYFVKKISESEQNVRGLIRYSLKYLSFIVIKMGFEIKILIRRLSYILYYSCCSIDIYILSNWKLFLNIW